MIRLTVPETPSPAMTSLSPTLIKCEELSHSIVSGTKSADFSHSSSTTSPVDSSTSPTKTTSTVIYNDLLCFIDNYHNEFDKAELAEILERNFDEPKMAMALAELKEAAEMSDPTPAKSEAAEEEDDAPLSQRLLHRFQAAAERIKFYACDLKSLPFNMKEQSPKGDFDEHPPKLQKCLTDPHERILTQLVDDVKTLKKIVANLSLKPQTVSSRSSPMGLSTCFRPSYVRHT